MVDRTHTKNRTLLTKPYVKNKAMCLHGTKYRRPLHASHCLVQAYDKDSTPSLSPIPTSTNMPPTLTHLQNHLSFSFPTVMSQSLIKMFSDLTITDKVRFLDLPPEIRQMVYKHAVPDTVYVRQDLPDSTMTATNPNNNDHTTLNIVRACKTTHAEFAHMYYGRTEFWFTDVEDANLFFATVGANSAQIRHVRIEHPDPLTPSLGLQSVSWAFTEHLTTLRLDLPDSIIDDPKLHKALAHWVIKSDFCPEKKYIKAMLGGTLPLETLREIANGNHPKETWTSTVEKLVLAPCPGHAEGSIFKGNKGDYNCQCRGGVKYRKAYKVLWELSFLDRHNISGVMLHGKRFQDGKWRVKKLKEKVPKDAE
ncbi:hypothetical protein BDZ85DRAFT_106388 [Elsinoe ampelina]|uniref:2EXR domain-containing protein n=1 Tax=Elsinoe ampelina TaxID=302913 RepID=A0A6A6FYM9_9PEZI|nr:hypothetical protein BDZ85DRAFT_106388 [Elsinoe ampelina]